MERARRCKGAASQEGSHPQDRLGIGRHQKMNLQGKIQKHERLKRLRVNKSPHCISKSPVDPTGSLREGKKPFAGTPLPSAQMSSMLYFT